MYKNVYSGIFGGGGGGGSGGGGGGHNHKTIQIHVGIFFSCVSLCSTV